MNHTYEILRREFQYGAYLFDSRHQLWYPVQVVGYSIIKRWLRPPRVQLYVCSLGESPVLAPKKWVPYKDVRAKRHPLKGEKK